MLILEPLYNKSVSSGIALEKERKKLLVDKTQIAGLANCKKKYSELSQVIDIANENILMPFVDVPLDAKIKSIMYAAEKSSVKIKSIKPMNYIYESKDGKSMVVQDKFFSIEGNASPKNFLQFLRNLWGTGLDNINLTALDSSGTNIRYYLKIEFMKKLDPPLKKTNNKVKGFKDFSLKNNPFTIIKPPPPPRALRKSPGPPPKPQKVVHSINGIELIGIADYGEQGMAIIEDKQKQNEMVYLMKGDSFRNAVVKAITSKSVTFFFSDNKQDVVVSLKDDSLKLTGSNVDTEQKSQKNKRKGHLGIMVETFSQDLANRYHMEYYPGLFVISPGRHKDVFKKHDVIIEINDQPVPNFEAALRVMNRVYAGQSLKIEMKRNGKTQHITYNAD